ncbi:hypothetical protein J6590_073962 [Homalodisca vitripennis]|nr:hypothetical protein J6590_073962 [Homalodisca vitripennis]
MSWEQCGGRSLSPPQVPSRLTPTMTIDRFPASSASTLDNSDLDYDDVDDSDADPDYVLPNDDNTDSSEEDCSEVSDDEFERENGNVLGLDQQRKLPVYVFGRLRKREMKRNSVNISLEPWFIGQRGYRRKPYDHIARNVQTMDKRIKKFSLANNDYGYLLYV